MRTGPRADWFDTLPISGFIILVDPELCGLENGAPSLGNRRFHL